METSVRKRAFWLITFENPQSFNANSLCCSSAIPAFFLVFNVAASTLQSRFSWLLFLECSALRSLYDQFLHLILFSDQNCLLGEAFADHSKLSLLCRHTLVVFSSLKLLLYKMAMLLIIYLFACLFSFLASWSRLCKKRDIVFLAHYCMTCAKNKVWQIGRTQCILVRWMDNYRILIWTTIPHDSSSVSWRQLSCFYP